MSERQDRLFGNPVLMAALLLDGRELFLPFGEFPWFRSVPVEAVLRVERLQPNYLYWPELDVDLDVDSIEHPERFPLKSRRGGS